VVLVGEYAREVLRNDGLLLLPSLPAYPRFPPRLKLLTISLPVMTPLPFAILFGVGLVEEDEEMEVERVGVRPSRRGGGRGGELEGITGVACTLCKEGVSERSQ
jgi:hypothetical protein